MGTWGTAIFSDDTASDVRNDFRELIGDGLSPEEATARLMTRYGSIVDDPEGGTTFWLGLAVTQWKSGRLQESVKKRALEIIDSGADLRLWSEDEKLVKARAAVLAETRAQLLSPQPAAKRIPKTFREANDWEVGELVSYRTAAGKHLVFRVVGHRVDRGGKRPQVHILDYYDDAAPTLDLARQLAPRFVIAKNDIGYHPYGRFLLVALSERELPKKRLTRLGMGGTLPNQDQGPSPELGLLWREADSYFERRVGRRVTWRPGPGGSAHEQWAAGDVLAYRRESGSYLLLHVIGRHKGHGVDGAPVVVHLTMPDGPLPDAAAIGAGALVPTRMFAAADPLLRATGTVSPGFGFVLVHDDEDAVDASTLRRIGAFPRAYDLGHGGAQGFPFASVPMVARRMERRARRPPQPA